MNTQPRMLKQKDLRRLMKMRLLLKAQTRAATKIQDAWRRFAAARYLEQLAENEEQYSESFHIGCDCGDWLCSGCDDGPYIPCVVCGSDCRYGDYESWRICSRRCLVRDD